MRCERIPLRTDVRSIPHYTPFIAHYWQSIPSSLLDAAVISDESVSTAAAHSCTTDSAVCEKGVEVSKDLSTTSVAAALRGAIVGRGGSHTIDTPDAFVWAIMDNAGIFLESLTDVSPESCAIPSCDACATNLSVSSQALIMSEALRAEAAVSEASTTGQRAYTRPPGTPFAQRAQASLLQNMRSAATLFAARSTDTARVSNPRESLGVLVRVAETARIVHSLLLPLQKLPMLLTAQNRNTPYTQSRHIGPERGRLA